MEIGFCANTDHNWFVGTIGIVTINNEVTNHADLILHRRKGEMLHVFSPCQSIYHTEINKIANSNWQNEL